MLSIDHFEAMNREDWNRRALHLCVARKALFHFQIDRRLGAKPQTVQTHGKAKQQQILLMWKWNYSNWLRQAASQPLRPFIDSELFTSKTKLMDCAWRWTNPNGCWHAWPGALPQHRPDWSTTSPLCSPTMGSADQKPLFVQGRVFHDDFEKFENLDFVIPIEH